jgi:16S rRNA processing protein RimM
MAGKARSGRPGALRPEPEGLVCVARVTKAHGIRGELCMDVHAGSPLLFEPGRTLFLAAAGGARPRPYAVAASREHSGRQLVQLAGVADRNAAEALRGAEVFAAAADLPPPDEGEEYLHRLVGGRVLLEDGGLVGVFEAVLDTPGQLTFVIRGPAGQEILFPAVPEFIRGLDASKREIVIAPPPGLLELYPAPDAGS